MSKYGLCLLSLVFPLGFDRAVNARGLYMQKCFASRFGLMKKFYKIELVKYFLKE